MQNDRQSNPDLLITNSGNSGNANAQPPYEGRRGRKVIQPSPGLAEELQAQRKQEVADQPKNIPQSVQSTQTAPAQPANHLPNVNQANVKPGSNQRVASRVPSVAIYAFLIMIVSAYSLISLSSIFHATRLLYSGSRYVTTGGFNFNSPVLLLAFGVAAVNIVAAFYLLMAKSMKTVSVLLTVLLIIGGINLLNSIVNFTRYIEYVNANSIVSLFISLGLLMYLWNVKSQVDQASL